MIHSCFIIHLCIISWVTSTSYNVYISMCKQHFTKDNLHLQFINIITQTHHIFSQYHYNCSQEFHYTFCVFVFLHNISVTVHKFYKCNQIIHYTYTQKILYWTERYKRKGSMNTQPSFMIDLLAKLQFTASMKKQQQISLKAGVRS